MRILPITDVTLLAQMNETIQQLHCELYPDEFMPFNEAAVAGYFHGCVNNPSFRHYAAYDGNTVMGFVQVEIQERSTNAFKKASKKIHVHQLVVLDAHRRKGVAKTLMEKVNELAAIEGIITIDLTVWDRNKSAIAFYASLGYKPDLIRMCKE